MKIVKFNDFLNEDVNENPEEYIKISLLKIKRKIESFFKEDEEEQGADLRSALERGKKSKEGVSFQQMGLELQSSEFSKFSSNYDNIVIKFSDEEFLYSLYVTIPLEEGISDDKEEFSDKDIKNCYIKFKKYDLDEFDLHGQISKNIKISDISEDLLIELKIELDDQFKSDDDNLEIES